MTKVCPECGGHVFKYTQTTIAVVMCDGDGKTLSSETPVLAEPTNVLCVTCDHSTAMDKLVTEEYFHLVICGDEDDENVSGE